MKYAIMLLFFGTLISVTGIAQAKEAATNHGAEKEAGWDVSDPNLNMYDGNYVDEYVGTPELEKNNSDSGGIEVGSKNAHECVDCRKSPTKLFDKTNPAEGAGRSSGSGSGSSEEGAR